THLTGSGFAVTSPAAGWVPASAKFSETTTDVPVGAIRAFDFTADNPGDWAFHCHKSHHTMNAMGHDMRNLIGVPRKDVARAVARLAPDSMAMGSSGRAVGSREVPGAGHHGPLADGDGQVRPAGASGR